MSDRSPADVLADAIEADGLYEPQDALDVACTGLAALAEAGYVISRPGDPWVDADGRRWEVRLAEALPEHSPEAFTLAILLPADDVEDTDG